MANIDKDIRAALESQLSNISGLPSIAYENVSFNPTTGQNYIEVRYFPVSRRPTVRGLNPQQRYDGIFAINCYVPEGAGPSEADTLAKNVMEAFEATTKLTHNDKTVFIDYAERTEGIVDSPFYFVPVTIGWYAYN
jgi:hypothetical protein